MRTVQQRRERARSIITGGIIGFIVAGTLAVPSILPPAFADDEPFRTLLSSAEDLVPKTIDGDDFVKPDFTVEPWVSTEALNRTTVRKISYGRTEFVSIVETNTGTYSSDGLESPHIRYPGIVKNAEAGSFLMLVPFAGGFMAMDGDDTCVAVAYGIYC